MANIFWTSCLQGNKSKNKYFLIHVHVYLMLQTNDFNRTSTSHKKWFYAILFRYVWYGCLLCLHNRDLKENTKPRKETNFTNLPYIGNFSLREILVKMRIPRCVKFSLSPIFAISRTLNEDVKYGLFFAASTGLETHACKLAKCELKFNFASLKYRHSKKVASLIFHIIQNPDLGLKDVWGSQQ